MPLLEGARNGLKNLYWRDFAMERNSPGRKDSMSNGIKRLVGVGGRGLFLCGPSLDVPQTYGMCH